MPVHDEPVKVEVQLVGARRGEVLVELLHRGLAEQRVLLAAEVVVAGVLGHGRHERLHVEAGLGLHVLEEELEVAPEDRIGLGGEALLDLAPRAVLVDHGHRIPPGSVPAALRAAVSRRYRSA